MTARLAAPLLLLALSPIACATSTAVPRPFPGSARTAPAAPPAAPAAHGAHPADPIIQTALTLRGVPYRNGGSDPAGFDCSGFVQYVFGQFGIRLPREVREQYGSGARARLRDAEPGDLVFFTTVAPGPSHVGVIIGNGEFIHAPSSRGVVRVERVDSSYWAPRIVGVRRVR